MTVLDGLSGWFQAGHLSAIMGPSGSGKTTFIDVLTGKAARALNAIFEVIVELRRHRSGGKTSETYGTPHVFDRFW